MLDTHPRAQLCFIIKEYGRSVIAEPKRCKGILSDLAPQHRLEINLLITALEQKVAQELLKPSALIPVAMQLELLAQRLYDNHGTQLELAYWAVESWALALNVIQQPMPKQTVQSIPKTSPTLPPKVVHPPMPTKFTPSSSATQQHIGKFIVQDGIATDTETGLTWLRFAHGQTWQNGTAVGGARQVDWQMAFYEARDFNRQGGYADYTDWRLPTIDELKTLINRIKGKKSNYIDADVFPNNDRSFWSSSPYAVGYSGDTSEAWTVGFRRFFGDSRGINKGRGNAVRFVRGGLRSAMAARSFYCL